MDIYRHQHRAKILADCHRSGSKSSASYQTPVVPADPMPLTAASDQVLRGAVVQAVRQRRYGWALQLLNQLISRHPAEANYYSNRGILHLWLGQYDAALNDCNHAIELEPNLDQAFNNRANCYSAVGLTVKALVDYERAVDLNPFNSRARVNLGVTLRSLGDLDAALNCFDEALLFYKLSAHIYAERGRTYHIRGDWNCAIADYRRAQAAIREDQVSPQEKNLLKRISAWMAELLPVPSR